MRRVLNILAVELLLFLVIGCREKDLGTDVSAGGDCVLTSNIIEFGVGISTRGDRINEDDTITQFGLYGYQYSFSENWSGVRALAKPNVFDSAPETVELSSGYYAYDPVKQWTGNKYSFFAYYPIKHSKVEASSSNELNTPYVTYTLDETNVDNLVDVMTAAFINTSVNSSKYVSFEMKHRLSAIDVTALNYYMVGEDYIDIEIQDIMIVFTNLKHNIAKIFLDDAIPSIFTEGDGSAEYHIIDLEKDDPYTIKPNQADPTEITSSRARTMLVIPQTATDLEVKTIIVYKKKTLDGNYIVENDMDVFTEEQATSFGMPLKEGSRYDVQITFTSAAISVSIVTAAQWDDNEPNVDHDFE